MSLREAAKDVLFWLDTDGYTLIPMSARRAIADKHREALRAALTEAEAPKAEPVAWALAYREDPDDYDHFTTVASTMKRWVEDEDNIAVPLYTHPPEPVESAEAELSDDDIEAIWFETIATMPRDSTNKEFRCACVRAVLAARGKG